MLPEAFHIRRRKRRKEAARAVTVSVGNEQVTDRLKSDPFTQAKANLISFVGGDWVPNTDNFTALKKRFRVAQATTLRIEADIARGNKPDIPLRLGRQELIMDYAMKRERKFRVTVMRTNYAILRAALTADGKTDEAREGADAIFNQFFDISCRTLYPGKTEPGDDDAMYRTYIYATKELSKIMLPLITTSHVITLFTEEE